MCSVVCVYDSGSLTQADNEMAVVYFLKECSSTICIIEDLHLFGDPECTTTNIWLMNI